MPALNVTKSVVINASAAKVRSVITNFKEWKPWSPWLILDPNTTLNYADDGNSYSWESSRIGSGEMKITSQSDDKLDYNLTFLKPWKSKSKVQFLLNENGDHTEVTWKMMGALPFFMFFMKKQMEAFVGMDYEKGLQMLKQYIEEGKVDSHLDFKGIGDFPGCDYIGISKTLDMDKMEEMGHDFEALRKFGEERSLFFDMPPFCIYHKYDPVKKKVKYTAGVPVSSLPNDLPDEMITGKLPAMKVHTVTHTGPYRYLGNVWGAQQSMMRAKEFKPKKGIHPFETYENMPGEVDEKDLITHVHFAVK